MISRRKFRSCKRNRRRLSQSLFTQIKIIVDHRFTNHQSNHENQLNQTKHEERTEFDSKIFK